MNKRTLMPVMYLLCFIWVLSGASLSSVTEEMEFGGQIWRVKTSNGLIAPGPNYWSNLSQSVWLDVEGMHLTLAERDGKWYATEVFTKAPLGYGTYLFTVESNFTEYDPNVVAGFFTWDSKPTEYNREIDIEFAAWGIPGNMKGQYVVQPPGDPGRLFLFDPNMQGTYSTHRIIWTPDTLQFTSWHGSVNPEEEKTDDNRMAHWNFEGAIPTEGKARFRINLWLFQGDSPSQEESYELTIRRFLFVPWEPKL